MGKYSKDIRGNICRPHIGKPYLSYSTHSSYNDYFGDFIKEKLVGIDLGEKIYADFGVFVGEAIENGKFGDNPHGFTGQENLDLTREEGVEYEKMILIDRGSYVIIGFIDIYKEVDDKAYIKDVKTVGKGKEEQYKKDKYIQCVLYSHAIELTGKKIGGMSIKAIRRENSHLSSEPMHISKEQFEIELPYNKKRVDYALKTMDKTATEVSELYKTYKKYFKK